MEFFRGDLRNHRNDEYAEKNEAADGVAEVHRHRYGVAARLPQSGREYLDDPEDKRDFRNLTSFDLEPCGVSLLLVVPSPR